MTKVALVLILTTVLSLPFMTLASNTAADLILQGDACDNAFKPKQALKHYLPAERITPDDPELLIKIARQYVYQMDSLPSKDAKVKSARRALAYSERAMKLAPNSSEPYLSVAICYGKLTPLVGTREKIQASSKIKQAAEQALKLDPNNDYAWHLLGRWHQALAGVGGVTRSVAKMIYGGLPNASYNESARCFERAKALNPNRLIHHIELGRTYAEMSRKTEAKRYITQGLAMVNSEFDDPGTKQRGRETLKKLH